MTQKRYLAFTVAALAVCGATLFSLSPAVAQAAPNLPDWVVAAPFAKTAFNAPEPGIGTRPAVLLETNFYVYGVAGFNSVDVNLTINDRRFSAPVTLYLYWQNRVTGETRYYNAPIGDFVANEIDLFGTANSPVAVFTPDLNDFQLFGGGNSAFGPLPASLPSTTGHYQLVLEVRRANNGSVVARGNAMYNWVDALVEKGGDVNSSETWTANNVYRLTSPVNFQQGTTLTIEPGTVILGATGQIGTLIIRRGARILADGTAMLPIIMSSDLEVGERGPGNWGGLVINGSAPTNQANPQGEGDSGPYGGNNPADNSGILRYVRVEFAGIAFTSDDELNGIALQGVGSGTTIDHVQVHFNQDDGIEFFGGTVGAKYVLITDARDDSVDWTFGWQGKLQHVVVLQRSSQNDHGIEADNFEDDPSAVPQSNPMLANLTFVGNGVVPNVADSDDGWMLRRGTGANITHAVVMNFANFGMVTASDSPADFSKVLIRNTFFFNNLEGLTNNAGLQTIFDAGNNSNGVNPQIPNPNSLVQPDLSALNGSAIRSAGALPVEFRQDAFFDNVTYAGGVNPNNAWIYEGWTTFSDN